jgi:hypothetical protein
MLRKPTVLVVGAGASCELGFPSGPALLQTIARKLNMRFEHYRQSQGSESLLAAYRRHHAANDPQSDINAYVHAGQRLVGAAKIARSIDNAIDQNAGNPLAEFTGKLAIAETILEAERSSKLFVDPGNSNVLSIDAARETWLFELGQILTTDVRGADASRVFENLTVVTFNYDRSLEHFLPVALTMAYGLRTEEAQAIVRRMKIHHVYGQVGDLPWIKPGEGAIGYGDQPYARLEAIAAELQTFSESKEPGSLKDIHAALNDAQQIAFVGFGYHRQNMDLLRPMGGIDNGHVGIVGSVFGESAPAQGMAAQLINAMFHDAQPNLSLVDCTCTDLLKQFYSVLTA